MNKTIVLSLWALLLSSLAFLNAQETVDQSSYTRPSERVFTEVEATERNPFAKIEEPKPVLLDEPTDSRSEENQLETILRSLNVSGRTRSDAGWKVLLGDMILEEGKALPPLIEGQNITLRIEKIDSHLIEIVWDAKDQGSVPKRTFIQVDLQPKVRTTLGKPLSSGEKQKPSSFISPPTQ